MSPILDIVVDKSRRWEPMSREQFRRLERGERVRDRKGREWTVTSAPREQDGVAYLIIRSGDLVRRVDERWADDYQLTEGGQPSAG
jgi:hypothetical protein